MPEGIVALVAIALAILLLVKLGRLLLKLAVVVVVLGAVLCVADVVECPLGPEPEGGVGPSAETADVEVVAAVFRHVRGKTWVDHVERPGRDRVPCTAADHAPAAADPLGITCTDRTSLHPWGWKWVTVAGRRPVPRPCPVPPAPASPEWHVEPAGPDQWVVANPRGRWSVRRTPDRYFLVTSAQPC